MAKELWELSDEELEDAFRAAKADGAAVEYDTAEEAVDDDEIDLEQPSADSDDDASDEIEVEDKTEAASETTDDKPDGDADVADEQTEEDATEAEVEEQPAQDDEVLTFKADGQDYTFTVKEMKEQFGKVFGQAMNYTKKMQALKPHRRTIDALETAGLTHDDVSLMIDVLKGDKDALTTVMKRTGVDALELDMESSRTYVPKDYGRGDVELDINEIVSEISRDREYPMTHTILEKQWDDASRREFVKDPELIRLLHTDVKSGMFDKVNPIAQKLKIYEGAKRSDLDYYKMAAQQYFDDVARMESQAAERQRAEASRAEAEARRVEEVKAKQAKAEAAKQDAVKRKAAAPTKKVTASSKSTDYLDGSDEDFENWYLENVTNKQ